MTAETLPRWDLTPFFPSLDSDAYRTFFNETVAAIAELGEFFDANDVRRRSDQNASPEFVQAYETAVARISSLFERLRLVGAYLGCMTSVNANDALAQAEESRLNVESVALDKLMTRYVAWVGSSDADALISASSVAKSYEYAVRRAAYQEQHLMSEAEEALASELAPAAITGWAKLHGNLTALLSVEVEVEGEKKPYPMSQVRSMASDSRREVRKAAYEAEIEAWKAATTPLAAALNGVKGYQHTLRKKRGYANDVEPTLKYNGIDAATLSAMQTAVVESFPDFRRYMKAKAKALGLEKLAWHDLTAPLGKETRKYSWEEATAFISKNFRRYSGRLADFADRSFDEQWHDAEPRVGKEGGAYCTGPVAGISRLFMNYDGSFGSISTLAHELGHAYHNLCLKDRPPLQRSSPMTLAETASIFCETIAFDGALETATEG